MSDSSQLYHCANFLFNTRQRKSIVHHGHEVPLLRTHEFRNHVGVRDGLAGIGSADGEAMNAAETYQRCIHCGYQPRWSYGETEEGQFIKIIKMAGEDE